MKQVLIITELAIWDEKKNSGRKVLAETISGFIRNGFQPSIVSSYSKYYFTIKGAENYLIRNPFYNLNSTAYIGYFFKRLWRLYFRLSALYKLRTIDKNQFDVFYGVGTLGFDILYSFNKKYNKVLIARHLGVWSALERISKFYFKIFYNYRLKSYKKAADLYIVTDDGTGGDKLLNMLGIDSSKIRYYKNGINKNINYNIKLCKEIINKYNLYDNYVLLTVCRLSKQKGVHRIINALPEIIASIGNVKLLVVGDGEYKEKLTEIAYQLKINEHVHFVGRVSHDEINNYFSLADIFLSLYDYSNAGNPLIEAMINGNAIIAINYGFTSRFIMDKSIVLLEPNEICSLPQKVIHLLKKEKYRLQIGSSIKNYAQNYFESWETRIDKEISEIRKL